MAAVSEGTIKGKEQVKKKKRKRSLMNNNADEEVFEGKQRRVQFNSEDDTRILEFLAEQFQREAPLALNWKGNSLWTNARRSKVTRHSAQAMRDRAKRYLIPNLENLNESVYISELERDQLRKGVKVCADQKAFPNLKQDPKIEPIVKRIREKIQALDRGEIGCDTTDDSGENSEMPAQHSTTFVSRNPDDQATVDRICSAVGDDVPYLNHSLKAALYDASNTDEFSHKVLDLATFVQAFEALVSFCRREQKSFRLMLYRAQRKGDLSRVFKTKEQLPKWKTVYTDLLLHCLNLIKEKERNVDFESLNSCATQTTVSISQRSSETAELLKQYFTKDECFEIANCLFSNNGDMI